MAKHLLCRRAALVAPTTSDVRQTVLVEQQRPRRGDHRLGVREVRSMCGAGNDGDVAPQLPRHLLGPRLRNDRVALAAHHHSRGVDKLGARVDPVAEHFPCRPQRLPRAAPEIVARDDPVERSRLVQRIVCKPSELLSQGRRRRISRRADEDKGSDALASAKRKLDGDLTTHRVREDDGALSQAIVGERCKRLDRDAERQLRRVDRSILREHGDERPQVARRDAQPV